MNLSAVAERKMYRLSERILGKPSEKEIPDHGTVVMATCPARRSSRLEHFSMS